LQGDRHENILVTGGTTSLAGATLAPGDTQAKPGKDNR
jgi:hypothetical protein